MSLDSIVELRRQSYGGIFTMIHDICTGATMRNSALITAEITVIRQHMCSAVICTSSLILSSSNHKVAFAEDCILLGFYSMSHFMMES